MARDLPKHLRKRGDTYEARVGVPKEVRHIIGTSELNEALGENRTKAIRRSHAVLADFHSRIEEARRQLKGHKAPAKSQTRLWTDRETAEHLYQGQIDEDERFRDSGAYAREGIDPRSFTDLFATGYQRALERVVRGAAPDDEIAATIGWAIEEFTNSGATNVISDTSEWRALARKLAAIQIEVLQRRREADTGTKAQEPQHPLLTAAPLAPRKPVSIMQLFDDYFVELAASDKGSEAAKRWRPGFEALIKHLGHDDATRVTEKDLNEFKAELLARLKAKTVRDGIMAGIRAVFRWAKENARISHDPAREISVKVGTKKQSRDKGFYDHEASAVLTAAQCYQPNAAADGQIRESAQITAAKRWAPWLCAYTGARIAEITQLRKQDVRTSGSTTYLHITPEAGSVKTGQFRDVPLHRHLIELGFLEFVRAAPDGPLFYADNPKRDGKTHPSKHTAGRVSQWVRGLNVIGRDIAPCHGWRHRFKTIGGEQGISERTLDAIQGHAPKTAGDNYGDVTLKAKTMAINKMPFYALDDAKNGKK